jgi:hypothetical protein
MNNNDMGDWVRLIAIIISGGVFFYMVCLPHNNNKDD